MASPSQFAANQANAEKSTGPKTESGKQRSRLNAYRHGLTGQICISTPEEQQAYDRHCAGIHKSLQPVGPFEIDLAQAVADNRWRLKRAGSLESSIFALGQSAIPSSNHPGQIQIDEALAQARTWLAEGKNLQLLTLYEQRILRAAEKNMATLTALQTARKADAHKALEEAQLLAQLAYSKGEKYNPAPDFPSQTQMSGFDFSTAGINRLLQRNQRVQEAKYRDNYGWDAKYPRKTHGVQVPNAA